CHPLVTTIIDDNRVIFEFDPRLFRCFRGHRLAIAHTFGHLPATLQLFERVLSVVATHRDRNENYDDHQWHSSSSNHQNMSRGSETNISQLAGTPKFSR